MPMLRGALIAAAAAVAALAGCGSSSSSGTSGGGGSSGGGGPLKLLVIGPLAGSPGFSLPQMLTGAQAAAADINSAGGINSRQVTVDGCSDQNDPNTATKCARQAVTGGYAAVVGSFSGAGGAAMIPILQAANIPLLGDAPLLPAEFASSVVFQIGLDGATGFIGSGQAAVQDGCKKIVTLVENIESAKGAEGLIKLGVLANGGNYLSPVIAPKDAPDFAPSVSQVTSSGADCVELILQPPNTPKVLGALAQSRSGVKIYTVDTVAPPQLLAAVGAAGDGIHANEGFFLAGSGQGITSKVVSSAQALDPKVTTDSFLLNSYAGAMLFRAAALKVSGDITPKSILDVLPTLTSFDTGLGPVIDFSRRNPAKGFGGLYNTKRYSVLSQGGKYIMSGDSTFDIEKALQAAGAAS